MLRKNSLTILFCVSLLSISARAGVASSAEDGPTLKEAYKSDFLIGAAINRNQFLGEDRRGVPIIKAQFDSITPENILKWESVHPHANHYDFTGPDRYVAFGRSNQMAIIGHTLVWHSQTPKWVFENEDGSPVDRETLLRRMRDHIQTVVGRYKGQIKGWDVVNEALDEEGGMRQSPWMKIIGEDYVARAFQYAHEADPGAELHYNDYSLENEPKRNGAIALVKKLQAQGIPITAVGIQGHIKMEWPTPAQEETTIVALASLGVKVMITELDVDVVPATQDSHSADLAEKARRSPGADVYAHGLPDPVQAALARRYGDMFAVFIKHHDAITRVTFAGVTDGDSWLNSPGCVNYPLLFDRDGQKKPAFDAVIAAAKTK
jgi:endo-1,4-beta-xylanase